MTVPTSPAFKPSLGKSAVNTTQSCSLIVMIPPEDRRLSTSVQSCLHRIAKQNVCEDGDQQACLALLLRHSANRSRSHGFERSHAPGHVHAKRPPKSPMPRRETKQRKEPRLCRAATVHGIE